MFFEHQSSYYRYRANDDYAIMAILVPINNLSLKVGQFHIHQLGLQPPLLIIISRGTEPLKTSLLLQKTLLYIN